MRDYVEEVLDLILEEDPKVFEEILEKTGLDSTEEHKRALILGITIWAYIDVCQRILGREPTKEESEELMDEFAEHFKRRISEPKTSKKTIKKRESKGPPPWNLVMPPSWEKYYHDAMNSEETQRALKESGAQFKKTLKFAVTVIISIFVLLLLLSLLFPSG